MTSILIIQLLVNLLMTNSFHPRPAQPEAIVESRQLVVVTAKSWEAVDGELQCYERGSSGEAWRAVGELIPVAVGRNGLAWGAGLHEKAIESGPVKKEGDGKAPAGIFGLSSAFGYVAKDRAAGIKLPYTQAVATLECVDDPQSPYYNKILDRKSVNHPNWKSSEQMLRRDELYRWGVVVDHNAAREPGCGSCIFLHIWKGPGQGTAGCTAMERSKIEWLLSWLDPKKKPVLVQLPRAEFDRLGSVWKLPERIRKG